MIKTSLRIQWLGAMDKRRLNAMWRVALTKAGDYWHEHFLARHFTPAAHQLYHAQARRWITNKRKRKKRGKASPLEWTEDLKRNLVRQRSVTATAKNLRIVLTGPIQLNLRSKTGIKPADEVRVVTERELQAMADVIGESLLEQMEQAATVETLTP